VQSSHRAHISQRRGMRIAIGTPLWIEQIEQRKLRGQSEFVIVQEVTNDLETRQAERHYAHAIR